ncbi:MAG: phytase [Hyphomonadaceae bacterium]|nr:phytase [Hyphomonadaceae bacterium]
MKTHIAIAAALVVGACASDTIVASPVPALRETAPMSGAGDRADDPAVWVNPNDPARSLILATNKDEGVYVYTLDGVELQKMPAGLSNNVDVRGNLAVASNDGVNALSWFRIDPATLNVTHAGDTKLERIEPYGVCAGLVGGQYQAAVTFKDGNIDFWAVTDTGAGPVTIAPVHTVKLATQLEGCVFDDEQKLLFVGEENHGLWAVDLTTGATTLIDKVGSGSGLVADVEGVSLWRGTDGEGFIVASAQSKDRYVLYDRKAPHAAKGVISVAPSPDGSIDGVSHTDGLDVNSAALPGFPKGVLVVQDDANPTSEVDQNFKIVDWREVEKALASTASTAVAKP